jgi:hypothetical protein
MLLAKRNCPEGICLRDSKELLRSVMMQFNERVATDAAGRTGERIGQSLRSLCRFHPLGDAH